MRTTQIERIDDEHQLVKTLYFKDHLCAKAEPGQFIMVWLPGVDEIPMSISATYQNRMASITVGKVGEATKTLHKMAKGDLIGIRGPFGNSFKPVEGKTLIVGGGTGIAPLAFLLERLIATTQNVKCFLGAKNHRELLFHSRIHNLLSGRTSAEIKVSTEDGSFGHKGLVTELMEAELAAETVDMVYACGRESMLLEVFHLAQKHKVPLQVSLERIMRCAIGLCGSCSIGKYRVCADGPIFTDKQLAEVAGEFGLLKRDFNGRKIST
jgi:dihydroorotate dehydrogenase electron transfer subunit